jgi:hypothetical protein
MDMPAPAVARPFERLAVSAALDRFRGLITVARGLVEAGREVELAGLEGEAARLCAATVCLPAEARGELRRPLEDLLLELDRLEAVLRAG